jgi:hypothetical protein
MLRKYSNHRTIQDNISGNNCILCGNGQCRICHCLFLVYINVTGYYAVFAQEIAKGNWYQGAVVLFWILLFLVGVCFRILSSFMVKDVLAPI